MNYQKITTGLKRLEKRNWKLIDQSRIGDGRLPFRLYKKKDRLCHISLLSGKMLFGREQWS